MLTNQAKEIKTPALPPKHDKVRSSQFAAHGCKRLQFLHSFFRSTNFRLCKTSAILLTKTEVRVSWLPLLVTECISNPHLAPKNPKPLH